MKSKIFKFLQFLIGICAIGAIVYGLWLLIKEFLSALAAASPEITAAIIGAMATILVGISALLISQAHERKRAADEAHRLKKIEIYQGFVDIISRMMGASNKNLSLKEVDPQELVCFAFKFKSDILLWGSPKVIKAQIYFETVSGSGDTKNLFRAVNSLYLAIREDIGLSNSGLTSLELVKLSLNPEARKEIEQ
ncbi:hypothetical protein PSCT_02195 [Pseudomonas sp. SCT]|uniref:DUF4760 domain-containing protein n=1 Tax=Pseudomonas songnenensis TaxID=1176259 RepID=A0ABX9UPG2_9PSED|nr:MULTISPECIES: hypothetical protein [Pseudomonas]MCQ4302266.1 hypothetical protein [Pseudomonas songnenensis]RMH94259.1 hypothetical protein EA798_18470 [Pseudomonas songnenensis]GCA55996.1 hypothetical protein PSCT_02195 [Pseudomonas sp. SCT]